MAVPAGVTEAGVGQGTCGGSGLEGDENRAPDDEGLPSPPPSVVFAARLDAVGLKADVTTAGLEARHGPLSTPES